MGRSAETSRFRSSLEPFLSAFLQEKRALGFRYEREEHALRQFDRFLVTEGVRGTALSRELVERWTAKRPHETARTHVKRLRAARQVCVFLSRRGCKAYVPSSELGRQKGPRFSARVFSRDEIRRMLDAADRFPARAQSSLVHLIIPEVFRVLYGCGLRVGELVRLTAADVDLDDGILRIREGKGPRDRLVPMAPALCNRLRSFAKAVPPSTPDAAFFPSPRGGHYCNREVYHWFRCLLSASGIRHEGRGRGPRLHEIRHAFAVHRLEDWFREGADLNAKLPLLATYMGHRSMLGTQWYLQLTTTLAAGLAERLDASFGHVIPRRTSK